jgi:hypothetical protein
MMTELEIEEAIREAWDLVYARRPAPPAARRLAAALLAVTGATPSRPNWVTPDDLWRDRLAVLAEHGTWLAAWGPRPGEPDCRVPRTLLPEVQARREEAYTLWRSWARSSAAPANPTDTPLRRGRQSKRYGRTAEKQTDPAKADVAKSLGPGKGRDKG